MSAPRGPVAKELKRQALNVAGALALFGAVYAVYNVIDYSGDAGDALLPSAPAKKAQEPRYFNYSCVRDQSIPIERDWKGNEIPLSSSLQASISFDRENKSVSTEGTGIWFDDLQDGAELTSRWSVKTGYTQSVRMDADELFGEEIKVDANVTPQRRVVYEQIGFDRHEKKMKTYMVSNEEENIGSNVTWYCADSPDEALKRVRAKWNAPPPAPPPVASANSKVQATVASVSPPPPPPQALLPGMIVTVKCSYAVGFIAPDGNEWDGDHRNLIELHQGNAVTNATPYIQASDNAKFYKGQFATRTVFVSQSDIDGTSCNSAAEVAQMMRPPSAPEVPAQQQQTVLQCPVGTSRRGLLCFDSRGVIARPVPVRGVASNYRSCAPLFGPFLVLCN